jgi:DNA-binding MarR family transcriptional regulator
MSSSIRFGKRLVGVMSPSVQKVFATLETTDKMYVGDIEARTRYSSRTVRQALRQLLNADLIVRVPDMYDMRRHYYRIVGPN